VLALLRRPDWSVRRSGGAKEGARNEEEEEVAMRKMTGAERKRMRDVERLVLDVLAGERTAILDLPLFRAVEKRAGFIGDDDTPFWDALYHLERDGYVVRPGADDSQHYEITAAGRRRRALASGLRVLG
jgi:hypothetical protein